MTELAIILGGRGSGKTTLALALARGWPPGLVWAHNPTADPRFRLWPTWTARRPPPTRGPLLLLADEADLVWPASGRPLEGWSYDAIELGRHRQISIIATARRPQTVHKSLRAYATRVYLGWLSSRLDLEFAARDWGDACQRAAGISRGEFSFVRIDP